MAEVLKIQQEKKRKKIKNKKYEKERERRDRKRRNRRKKRQKEENGRIQDMYMKREGGGNYFLQTFSTPKI